MTINANTLFQAFDATTQIIQANHLITDEFKSVQLNFAEKRKNPDARIVVYGVYNAGKSTLINALIGEEVANIADRPCTDRVDAYRWQQFELLDTPGIDAPIEHQQITDNEMLKADAVIFVVNPIGAADEQATLYKLVELLRQKKKVMMVCNEKQDFSEEDFTKIKDNIRSKLQEIAAQYHLPELLQDIPIYKVNARRAFQAKQKNIAPLLQESNYPFFEQQLKEFLEQITSDDIYARLKNELVQFLDGITSTLESRSKAEIVRKYDQLLKNTEQYKGKVRLDIQQEIRTNRLAIESNVRALLMRSMQSDQSPTQNELENSIRNLFEEHGKRISQVLEHEMQSMIVKVQDDIEGLQMSIVNTQKTINPKLQSIDFLKTQYNSVEMPQMDTSSVSPEMIAKAVEQISKLAKPEHIVSALKIVKDTLPSLMTGIGTKTMEKWATSITGKIPIIGAFIQAGFALFQIFREDPQVKQLQEQQRQRERAIAQINDFARDIAAQFENMISANIRENIDGFFSQISKQIHALRQGFSEDEQANSELIEKLSSLKQQANNA